jgi:hypothetical protein
MRVQQSSGHFRSLRSVRRRCVPVDKVRGSIAFTAAAASPYIRSGLHPHHDASFTRPYMRVQQSSGHFRSLRSVRRSCVSVDKVRGRSLSQSRLHHLTYGRVFTRTTMPHSRGLPRRDATNLKLGGLNRPPMTKTVALPSRRQPVSRRRRSSYPLSFIPSGSTPVST